MAEADGPCVIRRSGEEHAVEGYAIGLIVGYDRGVVHVREVWPDGTGFHVMQRRATWPRDAVLRQTPTLAAAEAAIERVRVARALFNPEVRAAHEALGAALERQDAAGLAALQAEGGGDGPVG